MDAPRDNAADFKAIRRQITPHCNGPAGRNGPYVSTALGARPAVERWSVIPP
jgi:hypothetical protein